MFLLSEIKTMKDHEDIWKTKFFIEIDCLDLLQYTYICWLVQKRHSISFGIFPSHQIFFISPEFATYISYIQCVKQRRKNRKLYISNSIFYQLLVFHQFIPSCFHYQKLKPRKIMKTSEKPSFSLNLTI